MRNEWETSNFVSALFCVCQFLLRCIAFCFEFDVYCYSNDRCQPFLECSIVNCFGWFCFYWNCDSLKCFTFITYLNRNRHNRKNSLIRHRRNSILTNFLGSPFYLLLLNLAFFLMLIFTMQLMWIHATTTALRYSTIFRSPGKLFHLSKSVAQKQRFRSLQVMCIRLANGKLLAL